jgi:uncharacterized protein (TIRG00374 family)
LVVAGFFVIALRPYLDAVPADLSVHPGGLAAFALMLVLYIAVRAARWAFLVRALAPAPVGTVLRVGLAGTMWIALLPFRLGELARPVLLSKTTGIDVRQGLGTVALERVCDGLMIGALFFATLGDTPAEGIATLRAATTGVMGLFVAALMVLLVMARWPAFAGRAIDATVGRVAPRLSRFASDLASGVSAGMAALPKGGPLAGFVAATAVYWAINAVAMWILATACDLPLSLSQTISVMAVMNIALLVPGGPAQLGVFQGGVVLGLSLFVAPAVVHDRGSTFVFYLYLGQLLAISGAGLWAQRSLRVRWSGPWWGSADEPADETTHRPGDEPPR